MKMITENLKFIDVFPDKANALAKRLHVKKDEIPFVRKFYISEKQEVDKKKRSVISYISTDVVDRDGERLLPSGVDLENYKKNPVVMLGHDYRSLPVGKNIWIKKDDKGLVAKTVFAKSERGDEIHRACTEDIEGTGPLLNGWSVGFIPIEWEDAETKDKKEKPSRIYKKWELLEYSIVPIPSCPEALTLAIEKGLISDRLKKDLEIEVVKDREIEVVRDKEISEVIEEAFTKASLKAETERIDKEFMEETITKPETTDQYHRIPVSTGHSGHRIRTITISASQGIKALYCGECKKVITYLFDINKFSMAEAQVWVNAHKEFTIALESQFELEDIQEDQTKDELIEEMALETNEKKVDKVEAIDYTSLEFAIKGLTDQVAELKEGRVLSTKNRILVKDVRDLIRELDGKLTSLLDATEPPQRQEEEEKEAEKIVVLEKGKPETDSTKKVADIFETLLSSGKLAEMLKKAMDEALDTNIKKRLGKVE